MSTSSKRNSLFYWDPKIHDSQHLLSSLAGGILGLGIFLTYYFFSRIESQYAIRLSMEETKEKYPWNMPWYYFIVGIFLCMSTASALGCMLSAGIRPRFS